MKARLKIKSIVLILLVMVHYTEELTWNTEMRSAVCCQCNKQLLIWNFTEGENERVTGLHWFFNENTLVCFASTITGFVVGDLYEDRVERNGTGGILLKNVSLNDTGEYTLYVKLERETKRNVQGINLTVVEPPPSQCKPIIKKEHPLGIISCSTVCERSPLSVDWIINSTKDSESIGPYFVVDSSGTSEQPICCLRDFKCLDYQTKFCTQNNISFTDTVNHLLAGPDNLDTDMWRHVPLLALLLLALLIILGIIYVLCQKRIIPCKSSFCLYNQDGKVCQDTILLRSVSTQVVTLSMLPNDQDPHADIDVLIPETPLLGTVQELNAEVKLDQTEEKISDIKLKRFQEHEAEVHLIREQHAVEPKHTNTVAQCNEDLQQVPTVAGTTDRSLQDSNQHVQIVNNISIDTDFLKSILHSNTALIAELQARKTETRKLKRQLRRKTELRRKENRCRYSLAVTQMECSDFKNNDTDTSETSESEDSFPDYLHEISTYG